MLNFYFLEQGLVIVSPPHFMYDLSNQEFLYMTKMLRQQFKYLENETGF